MHYARGNKGTRGASRTHHRLSRGRRSPKARRRSLWRGEGSARWTSSPNARVPGPAVANGGLSIDVVNCHRTIGGATGSAGSCRSGPIRDAAACALRHDLSYSLHNVSPIAFVSPPTRTRPTRPMRRIPGTYIGLAAILATVLAGCGSSNTTTSTSTSTQNGSGAVVLRVASPAGGAVVSANTINVQGTVTPNDATVQIDGQPAAVGNGVFTGTAPLQSGTNSIAVIGSASGYTPASTTILVTQKSTQTSSSTSHSKSKSSGGPKATPGIAHAAPSTGGQTPCGGGLSVGPDTTCAFAENVYQAYQNYGPGYVTAYSPVTQLSYTMYCSGATPVVCTGGNNASVYFYP